MYPLEVCVIGCDDDLLPHLRRELANQSVRAVHEFADAKAAIAALRSSHGEKRLLILHQKSVRETEELRRLGAAFAGWPILALMDVGDHEGSTNLVLGLMRAGAGQVVPLPLRSDDFRAAMDCIADMIVYAARDKMVIAVAGVTGGCGGTTLAVNLAYEIAQVLDKRCILADLALTMGTVASGLNVETRYTIEDLLKDVRRVDHDLLRQVLVPVTPKLTLLAGPHQVTSAPANPSHEVLHIVDLLKQLAEVVVLDVSSTMSDVYFEMLANAGQVVLVCEQTVPSVRALRLVREALGRSGDDWEFLVVNRYDPKLSGFGVAELGKIMNVSKWRTIADDPASVVPSVNHGVPIRLEAPNSRALADIDALAKALTGESERATAEPPARGLFGRMQRAFSHS